MESRRLWGVLVAAMLVGCAPPGAAPSVAVTGAAPVVADLGLPPCGKPPSPSPDPPPPGSLIPPGTVVTAVRDTPPITQFNAYVELTPIEIREWIEARSDVEVLVSEDEGFESELLVSDGEYHTFVKARAACASASVVAEVIAPAESDAQLPVPAGAADQG